MDTDRCDTVGMFCLRRAKSGGESGYSSALAAHDWTREIKPELLESIWNGIHLHRFGEPPYTPIRTSVFSEREGATTIILIGGYTWMAADEFDAPFSDREAPATFERLAADLEFRSSFQLERGEAVLFDNCAVLHNRTAFEEYSPRWTSGFEIASTASRVPTAEGGYRLLNRVWRHRDTPVR